MRFFFYLTAAIIIPFPTIVLKNYIFLCLVYPAHTKRKVWNGTSKPGDVMEFQWERKISFAQEITVWIEKKSFLCKKNCSLLFQANIFYSGCVIVEVRDYRHSPTGNSYDSNYVLLRPTYQVHKNTLFFVSKAKTADFFSSLLVALVNQKQV